jgi:hypothetical protein
VPDIIYTEFSTVVVNFKIMVKLKLHFTFVATNGPCTSFSVFVVTKTSFQLDHQNSNRMDDIVAKPLNVKFDFQIGHSPCFVVVEFTAHYKIEVVILFDYEN